MAKKAVKVNGTKVRDPEHQELIRKTAKHFAKDERKEQNPVGISRGERADRFMRTGK